MSIKLGSLFDGSGGFPLASALFGVEPVWASEIEPYPIRVTTARFPNMKHLGDVTKINGAEIEPVDIITFGSPCQDLSVAGKQAGIHDGERSNLFFQAIRIIGEMRDASSNQYPRFAVWENVPGAFSSNKGQDFKSVLEAFCKAAGADIPVPEPPKGGRWSHSGTVVGDGFSIAWRLYDAQYWGVPQRRKRIYLIADFAGERAGKILFESESLSGDSESRRKAWERITDHAERSSGRSDPAFSIEGHIIDRKSSQNGKGWAEGYAHTLNATDVHGICVLNDQGGAVMDVSDKAGCLRAQEHGHQPVVCYPIENHAMDCRVTLQEPDTPIQTLNAKMGTGGGNTPMVLMCMGATDANAAITDGEKSPALIARAGTGGGNVPMILEGAVSVGNGQLNQISMEPVARCLDTMHDQQAILKPGKPPRKYILRRLTPLECCRLQGFPDWWTADVEGSDSAQYKMWGNGIALPCAADVIGRLVKAIRDEEVTS